jgi:heterodisulfide reductase subunit A
LAAGEAHQMGLIDKEEIAVVSVSCAARINVETLLQPLVNGSKRVMIAACHTGNCRSSVGPENAAAKVTRIFTETHLPATMLSYHSIAANEPAAFAAMINEDRSDRKEKRHD